MVEMASLMSLGQRLLRRWPIRWKLTIVSASLTFVIVLGFGAVVGSVATTSIRGDFNRDLEQAATHLVSKTRIVERPLSEPLVYSPDLQAVSLPAGAVARVVTVGGVVLDEAPEEHLELGAPKRGVTSIGNLTVATQPVYGAGNQVVGYIQYARSDSHVDSTLAKLWLFIAAGILGGTGLAVLAGVALAGRAMKPIATLTSTAREIAATRDTSKQLSRPTAEDEVAELTLTLQEMLTELDASRAEREATMQKQRNFVADASHELRTPLTSILANLELLEAQLRSVDYGEERELVESAVRSSKRMSSLVADLLVLARSDAGQNRAKENLDLSEVAMAAAREMAPSLGDRDLHTRWERSPTYGNRDELHRLVLNLLDNAVRYSPREAPISLVTRWDREARNVTLEVADGGPGIRPQMREHVFERFVRGQNASDMFLGDGTGLGLAMVRAIATDHGGTATASESRKLGGALIVVSLPALDAQALAKATP